MNTSDVMIEATDLQRRFGEKEAVSGISLSARLADRRLARAAPYVYDTVRDQLLNIEAGAEQMLGLIDDLLDVAHLRAGHTLQL